MRLISSVLILLICGVFAVYIQLKLSGTKSRLYLLLPTILFMVVTLYIIDRYLIYSECLNVSNLLLLVAIILLANIPIIILLVIGRGSRK